MRGVVQKVKQSFGARRASVPKRVSEDSMTDDRLGKYQLTGDIFGTGANGKVYRGRSCVSGCDVAIKVLSEDDADRGSASRHARPREVLAMCHLSPHSNICAMHEHICAHGRHYVIMEPCYGGELFSQARRRTRSDCAARRPPPATALRPRCPSDALSRCRYAADPAHTRPTRAHARTQGGAQRPAGRAVRASADGWHRRGGCAHPLAWDRPPRPQGVLEPRGPAARTAPRGQTD